MLGIFHLGIVRDAAGKQSRSQIPEILSHAGQFGKYSSVGKEEPLENRTNKISAVFWNDYSNRHL